MNFCISMPFVTFQVIWVVPNLVFANGDVAVLSLREQTGDIFQFPDQPYRVGESEIGKWTVTVAAQQWWL